MLVIIKGAGDLASGVACRLVQCGFSVIMTETEKPTTVRCTVAFSRAVYQGEARVENTSALLAGNFQEAVRIAGDGKIALLVDPRGKSVETLRPPVVVDAILAKKNTGTRLSDAPVVVALGPGFTAGEDCHAVVETKRGHNLGRVYYAGGAEANTGVPGSILGFTSQRILRAPCDGIFIPSTRIGCEIQAGQSAGTVSGMEMRAQIGGIVRGLLPEGTPVYQGMKAGDVDPRGIREYCCSVSDKARAIGGGVLEAVLHLTLGGKKYEA